MPIQPYLAMTAGEFHNCQEPPEQLAWMACHFSPYGTGLSNLPQWLPEGSLLTLNDRIPMGDHDPLRIARELEETAASFGCRGILLDLQRLGDFQAKVLVQTVLENCGIDVIVSQGYDTGDCAVLLPAVPPQETAEKYLLPWKGRTVWLELDSSPEAVALTKDGAFPAQCPPLPKDAPIHYSEKLCSHYVTRVLEDRAVFTFCRTPADQQQLLKRCTELGIQGAVGLYQQFADWAQK